MIAMIMMLGFMHKGSCGYPIGGSLEFARAIERRYTELGGTDPLQRPGGEDPGGEATGRWACSAAGEEHRADEVISCADGHTTLFDMLEGKYLSREQRTAYDSYPAVPVADLRLPRASAGT